MASRNIEEYSNGTMFKVRHVTSSGSLEQAGGGFIPYNYTTEKIATGSYTKGIRPVFVLKPGIKLMSGIGTFDNPYTLGI